MSTDPSCDVHFESIGEIQAGNPTLIEGLPGHGLVASIAVDQITRQLGLAHHGNITSSEFPSVASFEDGRMRDMVRVYSGADPDVMTLQSDIALPPSSFEALSECVLNELATRFDRAIFLAGAPAEREAEIGTVTGVATTDEIQADLEAADIELAEGSGLVGGVTGALASACYHADLPAAILIVKAHPYLPDPAAAQALVENAIEPLVQFDIDTTELSEQADEIQRRMKQIAQHYQQMAQDQGQGQQQARPSPSMYQ